VGLSFTTFYYVRRSKELITILIFAHGLFPFKNDASFSHHKLANTIQYIKDTSAEHCYRLS
jgi:hypothetical protein